MKTKSSMSTIRLAALLIVINGMVLAQDRREFGTTWKLTNTQEESKTIASDDYEIVIRLGTDKSLGAILATAIIEIKNKGSELLTLDTAKVYIVDGDGSPLEHDSPLMRQIREAEEVLAKNRAVRAELGSLLGRPGPTASDILAEKELKEKAKARREAEIVEVPPTAKITKEVWRWEYGSMPKVLTLSILGLKLGDITLKVPILEFTPETENP